MSKQKAKGTAFETACVKFIKSIHYDAERLALHGSCDQGDIVMTGFGYTFIIECKNHKTYGRGKVNKFRTQAIKECEAYNKERDADASPLFIQGIHGSGVRDSIVHIPYYDEWIMVYLDDLFDYLFLQGIK